MLYVLDSVMFVYQGMRCLCRGGDCSIYASARILLQLRRISLLLCILGTLCFYYFFLFGLLLVCSILRVVSIFLVGLCLYYLFYIVLSLLLVLFFHAFIWLCFRLSKFLPDGAMFFVARRNQREFAFMKHVDAHGQIGEEIPDFSFILAPSSSVR